MVLNKSLSDIEEPVPASSPVMTFDASSTVHVYVVPFIVSLTVAFGADIVDPSWLTPDPVTQYVYPEL